MTDEITGTNAQAARLEYLAAVEQTAAALHKMPGYQDSPLQRADQAPMAKAILCHLLVLLRARADFRTGHTGRGVSEVSACGPYLVDPNNQVSGHIIVGVRVIGGVRSFPFLQFYPDDGTANGLDLMLAIIVPDLIDFSDAAAQSGLTQLPEPIQYGRSRGHGSIDPGAQAAARAMYRRLQSLYGPTSFPDRPAG
jgi:hypothetical protein